MAKYFFKNAIVDVPSVQVPEEQLNTIFIPLTQEELDRYAINPNIEYVKTGFINGKTLEEITFENLKLEKISELQNNYNSALSEGLSFNVSDVDCIFNLDDNTENNIAKQKIDWDIQKTQENYDENITWFAITDSENIQRIFNIQTFLSFSALFGNAIKFLKVSFSAKRNSIMNATNETELNLVDLDF